MMSGSKSQPKRSLSKAEAVLRKQWPEVIQYLDARPNAKLSLNDDQSFAYPSLSMAFDKAPEKALAMPDPHTQKT
jgi:hypothetical protein